MTKVPKMEVANIFAICQENCVATAFVFYCDAKHSDILWGSSHVHCYLFFFALDSFSKYKEIIM